MEKDSTSFRLPNTFRDSNQIPSPVTIEPMDFTDDIPQPLIQSVDLNNALSTRSNPNDRHRDRSIIQTLDNEHEHSEPVYNANHDTKLEAAGFNSNSATALDPDEAFALQLQQEEYSRESLGPSRYRQFPYSVDPDDESNEPHPAVLYDLDTPRFGNDEDFAAFLQEREHRQRSRYRIPPFPYRERRGPPNAPSTETSEGNPDENGLMTLERPPPGLPIFHPYNDDDDDDINENPRAQHVELFRQFFENIRYPMVDGGPRFHPGFRRGRRTGNLQDTEDDFGPEDYERLLQLDDSIQKKRLSRHQIDSIKTVPFHSRANNTEEENKCGVCLELFEEKQTLRQFRCNHVYHKECADRWLRESNACPICRKPPVDVEYSSNSRYQRHGNGHRRAPPPSSSQAPSANSRTFSNRNPTHRNAANRNPNPMNNPRRGPAPNTHQS